MRKWWEAKAGQGGSRGRGPGRAKPGEGLGDECEAWLAGRWAEHLDTRHQAVPSWAWLNQVAHASEEALQTMSQPPEKNPRDDQWSWLRACVAEALIKRASERGVTVADLQRSVLVPIELALFGDESRRMGDTELMIMVLAALRHPSAHPGPR